MRRFFVSPAELKQSLINLQGDEFHHLKNVCRLTEGERVELLDGQGSKALAVIEKITKKEATLKKLDTKTLPPIEEPLIEIVLCLPRFQKMDEIIQKSVELGVSKLIPVVSDQSFVKKRSSDLESKVERWKKIVLEACKQSGRAWLMDILQVQELEKAVETTDADLNLFMYEGEGVQNISVALKKLTTPRRIRVYIGAEGGFSKAEVELFKSRGMLPVTLGNLILRVETACITATAVIKYHFNLLG